MAASPLASANLLRRQLKGMQSDKDLSNISVGLVEDNIYEWEVMLMISDDCKFYGGAPLSTSRPQQGTLYLTRIVVRWFLPGTSVFPRGLSAQSPQYEIRNANLASKQYVC
jgi:hypothetical protein